jgi:hypothetical protein
MRIPKPLCPPALSSWRKKAPLAACTAVQPLFASAAPLVDALERALTGRARTTQSPVKRRPVAVSSPRWQAAAGGIVRAPHEKAN